MLSRRSPRWAFWPAKLLWAPSFFVGFALLIHFDPTVTRIDGGWRLLVSFTTPDHWVDHLGTFIPGLALSLLGVVLFFVYHADPGPGRSLTALDYPIFTSAAWIFGVVAVLAFWRTTGHVAEIGETGIDWRFLAYLRSHPLDYVLIVVAAAACIASALASWGFVSGRWSAPLDAYQHEQ